MPYRIRQHSNSCKGSKPDLQRSHGLPISQQSGVGAASNATIRQTTSNMTNDDNGSVVDDGTTSFSKEASRVTTNCRTPNSAKSNKLPPEFYALQQSAEICDEEKTGLMRVGKKC
jgi:hypothetical protein